MTRRAKTAAGFTLMEMMVALVIGAIFITPLYLITRSMSQQTSRHQVETEAMQRARMGLNTLISDFSRAGLFTSPNPAVDRHSMCRNAPNSSALYRYAVVHLNRGSTATGPDAVLLTGNFLGGRDYRAFWNASASQLIFEVSTQEDCVRQFNPAYAYAHITGTNGKSVEAKVTNTSFTTGQCTVTVQATDITNEGLSHGEANIFVSSNQTVLYQVEQVDRTDPASGCRITRNDLVRYFVDYDGTSPLGACSLTNLPGTRLDSTQQVNSRQVVAEYVEDFQVWFRQARAIIAANARPRLLPVYSTVNQIVAGNQEFAPPDALHMFPLTIGGTVSSTDLSCDSEDNQVFGAESVRSALIRLAVRTEKTEPSIDITAFGNPPTGRLARFSLAPYPSGNDLCKEKTGAAYKLKTIMTEVTMPNLAARSDILVRPNP